ncbi:hypothetical protein EDB83DRAFT_81182 [Lactarius deliciosus]|nr:hypothetical protein EDB83DRAFT_81182 [Lactarius deliciosus]
MTDRQAETRTDKNKFFPWSPPSYVLFLVVFHPSPTSLSLLVCLFVPVQVVNRRLAHLFFLNVFPTTSLIPMKFILHPETPLSFFSLLSRSHSNCCFISRKP